MKLLTRCFPILCLSTVCLFAQGTAQDYQRAEQLKALHSKALPRSPRTGWSQNGQSLYATVYNMGAEPRHLAVDLATGKLRESNVKELADADIALQQADVLPHDPKARSKSRGVEQTLKVLNATHEAFTMSWITPDGTEKPYATIEPGATHVQNTYVGDLWVFTDAKNQPLAMARVPEAPALARITGKASAPTQAHPGRSPDGKWTAKLAKDGHALLLETSSGSQTLATAPTGEHFVRDIEWSPDSRFLFAFRSRAVDERQITLVESSPADQVQPKTRTMAYVKPGDPIEQPFPCLFDVTSGKEIPIDRSLFANPWHINDLAWSTDSSEFSFVYNQRGHQVMRILGVRASDGNVRTIHEDTTHTFIDYSQKFYLQRIPATREWIWMSERNGWNHLYLIDEANGRIKQQITNGTWNVRAVKAVDAEKRTIVFALSGRIKGQDPYFTHYARVNFDGTGFTPLTEANGDHRIEFSPNGNFLVDTWSRVDQPPVTEIRRADTGALVCEINRIDDAPLLKSGWSRPEPFVAKGRDTLTDIYGILIKPSNFDPNKTYPVIENLYAGPHDAFVPKRYTAWPFLSELAELGFIVVQIDGMGTNWRGKAFHDVAYKNLADAGLPDRIAWMKAAATTRPWMDLTKVGVFGTSAGGQNALSAMLHHGDFYKAAVAACGCHDNRMDKIWWNEAWMGWPVDDSYARNSNVTHADKLQGKLMLIVGELDPNVDPSSTLQVVNALEKANKDFDLLVITGTGHFASETPYAARRRADFFVRNLLGVEPRR